MPENPFSQYIVSERENMRQQLVMAQTSGRLNPAQTKSVANALSQLYEVMKEDEPTIIEKAREQTGEAIGGFIEGINPVSAVQVLASPIETGKEIISSIGEQYKKAATAPGLMERIARGIPAGIPIVGAGITDIADDVGRGDYGKAVGKLGALILGGKLFEGAKLKVFPKSTLSPSQVAAVEFAEKRNIPVDLPTATGDPFLRSIKAILEKQPFAAPIIQKADIAVQEALAKTGETLKSEISTIPATKLTAGAKVRGTLDDTVGVFNKQADDAYNRLREIAMEKASPVQIGTRIESAPQHTASLKAMNLPSRTVPVREYFSGPVSMTAAKKAFQPLREQLEKTIPLAQLEASPGYRALREITNADDIVDIATADQNLSKIKTIAHSEIPELRTRSQGIAASMIPKLQADISVAVKALGPEAEAAIANGRKATIAKYQVGDLLRKQLNTKEPVRLFSRLVQNDDASAQLLGTVAKIDPGDISAVARATVEGILSPSTVEGGFKKGAGALARWEKLGPQTKKILFADNPQMVSELDNYFRLGKMMTEQINPSQSATVGSVLVTGFYTLRHPITGTAILLSATKLARILTSPDGARLLAEGIKVPIINPAAKILGAAILSRTVTEQQVKGD